ncbi:MAG: glycosyltransferase family 2 protein [Bacteroidia bacterium]|nr:glycosyltransferase family 2 protein [Bacteroidia bacterium]MCZ2278093.1 glycosyltransferase family 2 protein [Bacteroidia bacterium]
MAEISAVIIAFNEEKKIANCIESLLKVCDEIVVVDSFSTDGTAEIAESLGAKVIKHPFENYIEQKNFALDCLSYEWALSLDADEVLSSQLQNSILAVKTHLLADGYLMNRLTSYCGKWIRHCGWYPDRKLRLFKRSKARWGGINPHDKIEMEAGSIIHRLKGDLLHYSFDTPEQYVTQQHKFAAISARHMHQLGKQYSWPVVFAKTAFRFIKEYVIKAGFLEGVSGFKICSVSAGAVFRKYSLLKKMNKN